MPRSSQGGDHDYLAAELEGLGLAFLVEPEHRLPQLNAVRITEGVEDAPTRARLLKEFGIEIGGGLGPLAGRVWRIGLMGETCREESVDRLVEALSVVLRGVASRPKYAVSG